MHRLDSEAEIESGPVVKMTLSDKGEMPVRWFIKAPQDCATVHCDHIRNEWNGKLNDIKTNAVALIAVLFLGGGGGWGQRGWSYALFYCVLLTPLLPTCWNIAALLIVRWFVQSHQMRRLHVINAATRCVTSRRFCPTWCNMDPAKDCQQTQDLLQPF